MRVWVDGQVKNAVEDVLNDIMEAEAKALAGVKIHERTDARKDYRNGHRKRKLVTRVGEVELNVPRLRSVSPSAMSELNKKVYDRLDEWRNRPLEKRHPYMYLDGMVMSRRWTGEVSHFSVLVAVGVNEDGVREVIGVSDGAQEYKASWLSFLRHLKERGLLGFASRFPTPVWGLWRPLARFSRRSAGKRCAVHFYRNVLAKVPHSHKRTFSTALKAVHAQESREAAMAKVEALRVSPKLPRN